jgi:hypothetical protein
MLEKGILAEKKLTLQRIRFPLISTKYAHRIRKRTDFMNLTSSGPT